MQRERVSLYGRIENNRLIVLCTVSFLCIFHLMSCVALSSDPNSIPGGYRDPSVADCNNLTDDSPGITGPVVLLSYNKETFKKNPISSFMYFVPLISPTLVNRETSADNEQQVGIISYKKKVTSRSFLVVCEFEIKGKGFHKNRFDSAGMIQEHTDMLKKGDPLTRTLDYIKFEGEGFGRIEVKGTIAGSAPTVTEVNLQFNARGRKSPVTIGLYDIKPKEGKYRFENRSNEIVARVITLAFKKTDDGPPLMGIKVASISDSEKSEGFFSSLKGMIANLFIDPVKIDKLGNETMLNFGFAMLEQKTEFTFPKARNIKEDKAVETDPRQ